MIRADGTTWSNYFSKAFKAACAEASIVPSANFYVLRHTYATHAILNGVPLIVVARQLGHSTTRMVEKHYGHIAQGFRRRAHQGDAISRMLAPGEVTATPRPRTHSTPCEIPL